MTLSRRRSYTSQTPNLFANPPDAVRNAFHALDDSDEEAVGDLHQHGQSGCDNRLHVGIFCRNFGRDAAGEIRREGAGLFLDLIYHLFVHLANALTRGIRGEGSHTHLDGIYLEVEILVFDKAVDALGKHPLEVALAWTSTGVRGHHARDGGIGPE